MQDIVVWVCVLLLLLLLLLLLSSRYTSQAC